MHVQTIEPDAKLLGGFLGNVTALVLTYNEAPNLARTLDALRRLPEVVVLDSGSTDETREIAASYPNARVEVRSFDEHARQWNHGLTACNIQRPWVLALDADFVVSPGLIDEIDSLLPRPEVSGFRVSFRYCVFGKPLTATLYPPLLALYRRERARYVQAGHTQRVLIDGQVEPLANRIDHDDRKPLTRWLASQQTYARLEAEHLLSKPVHELRRNDRIRLLAWPAPIMVFAYTLIAKRCIFDGWPGWYYVLQRTLAETMIALEIVDRRLRTTCRPK